MQLPLNPPVLPMLAKRVSELPETGDWIFEPKWDGFRALVFRDGDEVFIQSRDEKPLNRYFPELIEPLKSQLPKRACLTAKLCLQRMAHWTSKHFSCEFTQRNQRQDAFGADPGIDSLFRSSCGRQPRSANRYLLERTSP